MRILLSIKPKFVKKIFFGKKKFEYRKKIPKNIKEVIVYSSAPEKKVIGKFSVKKIMQSSPNEIWEETYRQAGIEKHNFDSYFLGKKTAFAIEIDTITRFTPSKKLGDYNIQIPPQSFQYIKD